MALVSNMELNDHGWSSATAGQPMVFIHGWPDDASLWDKQVAHFKARYHCYTLTMPHFGGRELAAKRGNDKVSMWQNNFDHSAVAIAAAIKRAVGDTKVLLVIHDWGAMWGFMCQNLFPQQVKAIIALDVGPPMFNHRKAYHIIPVVIVGIIYQYWLAVAYLISKLPVIGQPVGDAMCKLMVMATHEHPQPEKRWKNITADACYPYFFFHWNAVRELLGLSKHLGNPVAFDQRPTCPCLFFYGGNKPFNFHDPFWAKALKKRPDCDIVSLPCGHWIQDSSPDRLHSEMEKWLDGQFSADELSTSKI